MVHLERWEMTSTDEGLSLGDPTYILLLPGVEHESLEGSQAS